MQLPLIEKYEIKPSNWVEVVRCNLIEGGFKRLAIDGVYSKAKADNLVFASNSLGSGSLALISSLGGIAAGIAQIRAHNSWETLPEIIIVSLLGWALLLKAAAFAIAPRLVDRGGNWAADSKVIPVAGVLMLIVGAYLFWFGYFA